MSIDEQTKVMLRFHREPNGRGLSIYNPYFQETGANAVYVLAHNPDPEPLVKGLRSLNFAGAIPAGFEKNPDLVDLLDELDPVAQRVGKAAIIANEDGKLVGYSQQGYGLAESIRRVREINGQKVVILGAGTVVTSFLTYLQLNGIRPSEIEVYNRTPEHAESLAAEFPGISQIGSMADMEGASGDIFVNCTGIGSPWLKGDAYEFKDSMITNFECIADVTFVPLKPQLIELAERLGKSVVPGWQMFLHQGKMCLEKILQLDVDEEVLQKHILKDFKQNWG